jgi:hypothetical protein
VLTLNQVCGFKFQVFTGSPIHPPLGALKKKCTVCGERRFVEVENDDGLTVTTKIARK